MNITEILQNFTPDVVLNKIAEELAVNKWVKKLTAQMTFKLLAYSMLSSERNSLRVMQTSFKDPFFQSILNSMEATSISHVAISNKLKKVNSVYFSQIYEFIYKKISMEYTDTQLENRKLRRYDSTMVASFSHLISGMRVGNSSKNKVQIKFTTEFQDDLLIRMQVHQDQAHLSEETALKESILLNNSNLDLDVVTFDKGLKSRASYEQMDEEQIFFVSRLSETPRYVLEHPHLQVSVYQEDDELELLQDSIVRLYSSGNEITKKTFRLIQYKSKKKDTVLFFVTNILDMEAKQIAQAYRSRWDIEVLFRFLKQEMNLNHLVCNDANAIQVMVYMTQIVAMLILLYKKTNEIKSYKLAKIEFFKELLASIILTIIESPELLKGFKEDLIKFVKKC